MTDWRIEAGGHEGILIGGIYGSSGGLVIRSESGKFYWMIENIPERWSEIPESLYMALFEYERERNSDAYIFSEERRKYMSSKKKDESVTDS
jgi:gas vesicle protein